MQENKKKIIENAVVVFSEKGIHQATLGDIAAAAGISKGTLFYYYRSKKDLLYDILDISIDKLTNAITGLIKGYNGEIKREIANEILVMTFKRLLKYDFYMKINYYLLQEALLGNASFKEKFKDKYSKWREDIKDYLKELGVAQPEKEAAILLAAFDGLCIQYLLDPNGFKLEKICDGLAEMFFKM